MKSTKGWQQIAITKLVKADWNYKLDDADKLRKLKANIEENGQIENIIIRELDGGQYEVVNGNHRLDAFSELGKDKVMCFNLGVVSDQRARRIAIETNETRFETDNIKLAELIKEIAFDESAEFTPQDIEMTMPYATHELRDMIDILKFDWEEAGNAALAKKNKKEKKPTTCPKCGHSFEV